MLRALFQIKFKTIARKMGIFTQQLNPLTRKSNWQVEDDNYDFHMEVARSAFADMLHDTERNQKYYAALMSAVNKMHSLGKEANVLDIGTGTGLLSMMAVRCGADSVVACEAFSTMAKCAKDIIHDNGFSDKIIVIPMRSTDIKVGDDHLMRRRANILVTELFDTELIGEGAISTFIHAHKYLLEKDCIVVPSFGTIYAQVVQSPLLETWNRIFPIKDENEKIIIQTPKSIYSCANNKSLNDIQLSQLASDRFTVMTDPIPVLTFDWSGKTPLLKENKRKKKVISLANGTAQWVFMWWDLNMDTEGKILLSCAPHWAHPDTPKGVERPQDEIPWRDHWMQAVYNLPQGITLEVNQEFHLISIHDEYSLNFNVTTNEPTDKDFHTECCSCLAHYVFSRTRMAQLNQTDRNNKYLRVLKNVITSNTVCLVLNDASILGLAIAKFGANHVYLIEENFMARQIMESFVECNKLIDKVTIFKNIGELKESPNCKDINLLFGEPFFMTSIVPWENALMGYLKNELLNVTNDDIETLPKYGVVYAIPVEFKDLHKIRSPLKTCEGFKMDAFDELIDISSKKADSIVEAQPLWEYPCKGLGNVTKVLEFDFTKSRLCGKGYKGEIKFKIDGICNGVALWIDWDLNGQPENIVSTGPTKTVEMGKFVEWDMFTKQGVHLIQNPVAIKSGSDLEFDVNFNVDEGNIDFFFEINNSC